MSFKSTLLLGVAALTLICSSCVREYTCQCRIKYSGKPGLPDSLVREYPIRDKKADAKSLCEQNSLHSETNGVQTDEDCSLY